MEKYSPETFDGSRNIIFAWPVWVGKTTIAQKLLRSQKVENILSRYEISDAHFKQLVKSNQLILRSSQDYEVGLEFYPLEMMRRSKVLLYDDIGVSDVSDAYIRDLTYVLDERIKQWLCTIFTTNLTGVELENKLNERIVSRVLYNADIVVMKWHDYRKNTTKTYSYDSWTSNPVSQKTD